MSRLDLARIKSRCTEDGDCLLWTGKVYKNGHPAATEWIDGMDMYVGVRRRAYEEYNGVTLPPEKQVATCGHPACLAKGHLVAVSVSEKNRKTHATMNADARLRRNMALSKASRRAMGKLTPEQVAVIRDSEEGPYVVAQRLGVNGVVASRVKRGLAYRDYAATPFAGLMT